MDRPPCGAKLERGGVCRAFALEGGRCWNHAPDREEERRAARSKGGKLRAIQGRRSRLVTVPELLRFNADVVHRAISGELPPDLARVAIYGLTLQRALIESGDLAARLEALEQRLADQGSRKWA